MKSKYLGATFIVIAILALAGMVWSEIRSGRQGDMSPGLPPMKPLIDFKVPSAIELEKMDRLERGLSLLSAPLPQRQSGTDLSVLGYIPVDNTGRNRQSSKAPQLSADTYQVTLAFEGRYHRYCVINGRLLAEGAVLPDGTSVLKVESRRVLIGKHNTQRWLTVEPLFQSTPSEEES